MVRAEKPGRNAGPADVASNAFGLLRGDRRAVVRAIVPGSMNPQANRNQRPSVQLELTGGKSALHSACSIRPPARASASVASEACRRYRSSMSSRFKAVLLDRDGVINFDSPDYILTPEQWRPVPGSLRAIARLTAAGIPAAICSNQSALGRGMLDEKTFQSIHAKMMLAIEEAGGEIAHVAYCPHAPEDGCKCRKPLPGLLHEALQMLDVAAENALMIGDSVRDVQAAKAAGVQAMLVQSGYGEAEDIFERSRRLMPDIRSFPDLAAAVDALTA